MLIKGRVFKKEDLLFRVVLVRPPEDIYIIGLEGYDREVPKKIDYKQFFEELKEGLIQKASDPYIGKTDLERVTTEQLKRAEKIFNAINYYWSNPVLKMNLFDRNKRKIIQKELVETLNISEDSVRRYLTRFFRRGMTRNALLPDFSKRGGIQKKGRIKNKSGKGLTLNDQMRENFRKAYYKYCEGTTNTLEEAHNYLIKDYYPEAIEKEDLSLAPSFNQFYRWVYYNISKFQKDKSRFSESDFENNHKILSLYATSQVECVGQIFEMDDTQLDIYLVSSANRNIVIGKPHLFSIIDLYSSLICGFCLSLEPESWATASRALNHCVEDKVKYCDQYGIKIEEWEWPCHYLPGALMNDNGKVKSHHIEPIALEYGLDPLYAKAYTPIQKGKIERSHRKYNEWIRRKLPGASQDNEGERGAADYAEKACLTLEELTKIIILLTLDFNRTPVSKYPLNSELLSQDYIPSPAELWQMSLENTGGNLIMVEDKNRFRILTLPHTTRMIRQEGVQIHNLMYSSTDPRIQTVLYNNIKKSATVFYDILDIRKIYLWLDNTLYPLTLKNPYSFKDKMSLAELNFFLDRKNELYKQENFRHKCERLDTEKEINNIVDQALQESHVTTSKVNVRERKREIIQNKVNGLPEKPEITERRPAKNLYKRFDDERKKVLQEWR